MNGWRRSPGQPASAGGPRTEGKIKNCGQRQGVIRTEACFALTRMGLSMPNFTTAAGSGMKAPCAPQYPGPCSAQLDGQVSHPRLAA